MAGAPCRALIAQQKLRAAQSQECYERELIALFQGLWGTGPQKSHEISASSYVINSDTRSALPTKSPVTGNAGQLSLTGIF